VAGIAVAEGSKKTGIRKKAVRVRAYRYRQAGIPLKEFPPVELPDWDELAVLAKSLLPKGAVATGVGRRDEDEEDPEDPSDVEEEEPEPAAVEEEEDSPAPAGEAEAEPIARDDVHLGDAASDRGPQDSSNEAPSEGTAPRDAG
jgi:hypothetical protein